MTPLPGNSGDAGDWGGRVPKSLFWNNTLSLVLTFAAPAPPGAAAGAGAEFREASLGATLLHFSEGRLLCVGCEHWAYLSVET